MTHEVHFTSARSGTGRDDWRTPAWLFERLDKEFHFNLDAAATVENKLCSRWFGPDHPFKNWRDALVASWDGTVWLNCPYSKLALFLEKAAKEAERMNDVNRIVMLVPARTDTRAWHDYVMKSAREVRLIKGRLRFAPSNDNAPFPSAIVVFGGVPPGRPVFSSMEQTR